ncbi:MAG: hypothetical protein AAF541_09830 [Pseudomonadota bacterium]
MTQTLTELLNNRVLAEEIDELGHLSVPFYEARAVAACRLLLHQLGCDLQAYADEGVVLCLTSAYLRNIREQFLDAPLTVRGGVLSSAPEKLRFYQELHNSASKDLSALFIQDYELRRIVSGQVVQFEQYLVSHAHNVQIDLPDYGRPRTLDVEKAPRELTLEQVTARGLAATCTRTITAEECDERGVFVAERFSSLPYVGFDADEHTLEWVFQTSDGLRLGLADLESRSVLYQLPLVGHQIQVFSANVMIGPKVFQRTHWVFDVSAENLAVIASTVSIPLDLDARKSVPIPEEMLSRLQAQYHPDLG